tara:strand:+ start:136 stop:1134 length:999 start_codon:yes stop_codon:yes gene_type:complete
MREGSTAGTALRETIDLAVAVESLGYHRYWVAEHHSIPNFAGTSPEVLIGQIAAQTETIRVGSGGVMLSHYSSLKVAENFSLLNSLYPGRIDLGIGRAPGSDQVTASALAYPSHPKEIRYFPQQIHDLLGFLSNTLEDDHPFSSIQVSPSISETSPAVWLLGSRYDSAMMAAQMGLPFAYAHFFGSGSQEGPAIVDGYRRNFQPSDNLSEPLVNVGIHVLCADTEKEALKLASSRNLARLKSITGRAQGIPSVEDALNFSYRTDELAFMEQYSRNCVDGDPQQVKQGLHDLAERYQTSDLSIVTICYAYEDRLRSYQLIAKECGLGNIKLPS